MFLDTVNWTSRQGATILAETAARFGFHGIVFNVDIIPPTSSNKNNLDVSSINPIVQIKVPLIDSGGRVTLAVSEFDQAGLLTKKSTPDMNFMTQISRATVRMSDANQIGFLNLIGHSHKFDLVAVCPDDERAWNILLGQGEFDIVKIDLTSGRLPFPLRRHQLLQLARRGISFDICLSGAIQDPTSRRHLFTNIQQLVRFLPHDKIFMTSGASHPLELRCPHDVSNIAQLMGFRDKPQCVMSDNAIACLYKGAARRTAGGMVGIGELPQSNFLGHTTEMDVDE